MEVHLDFIIDITSISVELLVSFTKEFVAYIN